MTTEAKKTTALGWLGRAWFWFSQITSVIGLIGIIDDLRLWNQFWTWFVANVEAVLPSIAQLAAEVGRFVHAGLDAFRSAYRPVIDFLLQWLPFKIPTLAKDVLFVAAFILLGSFRARLRFRDATERAADIDATFALAAAESFGISVDSHNVTTLRLGVRAYGFLESPFTGDDEAHAAERVEWRRQLAEARQLFGPSIDDFAKAHPQLRGSLGPRGLQSLKDETRALMAVWVLGAATAALILGDFLFYSASR